MAEGSSRSFLSLLETHGAISELLLRHQEALLELDLGAAVERFERFEAALRTHATQEEEVLLPVYEQAGPLPGGSAELFRGEHRKMLARADRIAQALRSFEPGDPVLRRKILQLFDEEAVLKSLLAHHDERERNLLYPALDRATTPEQRRALLERLSPLELLD